MFFFKEDEPTASRPTQEAARPSCSTTEEFDMSPPSTHTSSADVHIDHCYSVNVDKDKPCLDIPVTVVDMECTKLEDLPGNRDCSLFVN